MRGKVAAREISTGKCIIVTKEEFNSSDDLVGIRKGFKVKLEDRKTGYSLYKNSDGVKTVLHREDPRVLSGEFVGINKGTNVGVKGAMVMAEITNNREWYEKHQTTKNSVKFVFTMKDWHDTVYDPVRYKKTGLSKFCAANYIKMDKSLRAVWHKIIDGYDPYKDEGLIDYVNKNQQKFG